MTPEEFENAARFLKDRSGLVLTRDKTYLLENRLIPVVRALRLKSVSQLLAGMLVDDGVLYLGLNETVAGVTSHFRAVVPELAVYAAPRADRPAALSLASKVDL